MSPIVQLCQRLAALPAPVARLLLEELLASFSAAELACANYDRALWARESQQISSGDWRSAGWQLGRGGGKTWATVTYVLAEIAGGRARRVALVGQNESSASSILVEGETGILALAPPWLGASWEPSTRTVRFANGARAGVYSAESPNTLRGPQFDLALCTELASWNRQTGEESLANVFLATRLGAGKIVWDSTPRARNPLIKTFRELAEKEPDRHTVVTGSSEENALFLAAGAVAEWRAQYGGTRREKEEIDGEFISDEIDGVFRRSWIEASRRPSPAGYTRRIISVDPANSTTRRSDATGIVEMGRDADGQLFAIRDMSGKHRAEVWPGLVVDAYIDGGCDLAVCEVNNGNENFRALFRGAAERRGLSLVELGPTETPRSQPGVFYYRPIIARGRKLERAQVAAAHAERGKVSFAPGLALLEEALVDFDGRDGRSDDRTDAFVHGVLELAGAELGTMIPARDPRAAFKGIATLTAAIELPHATIRRGSAASLAELLGNGYDRGGI